MCSSSSFKHGIYLYCSPPDSIKYSLFSSSSSAIRSLACFSSCSIPSMRTMNSSRSCFLVFFFCLLNLPPPVLAVPILVVVGEVEADHVGGGREEREGRPGHPRRHRRSAILIIASGHNFFFNAKQTSELQSKTEREAESKP